MRTLFVIAAVACGGSQSGRVPVDPPARAEPPAKVSEVTMPPVHPWPTTRVGSDSDTLHGQKIADPYRWLEDENSPEVQAWMTAQDDYARSVLGHAPHRDEWVARLKQVFYFDAVG